MSPGAFLGICLLALLFVFAVTRIAAAITRLVLHLEALWLALVAWRARADARRAKTAARINQAVEKERGRAANEP